MKAKFIILRTGSFWRNVDVSSENIFNSHIEHVHVIEQFMFCISHT